MSRQLRHASRQLGMFFWRDPLTLDLADSSEDGRQRKGDISQERGDHLVVAGCPLQRVERVAVERENHHRLALWIDDPVLTDASSRIECPLGQQIMSPIRWTEDFNQEIGRVRHPDPRQWPPNQGATRRYLVARDRRLRR